MNRAERRIFDRAKGDPVRAAQLADAAGGTRYKGRSKGAYARVIEVAEQEDFERGVANMMNASPRNVKADADFDRIDRLMRQRPGR